jgi:mRNA-degrading endonuclease RelE of RelBE toxin-antitoxin system
MGRSSRFTLIFAPEAVEHLDQIDRKHHSLLEKMINEQLVHSPVKQTRNRKPLDQPAPSGATWELLCGPDNRYRILYEVNVSELAVSILAIGIKQGNRLVIGGEEFE